MKDLEFDVLENPRRRRHRRRGMSALQRKYFGGGGRRRRVHRGRAHRRSSVLYANPRRVRARHRRSSYRVVHRLVRRRNPGFGGITGTVTRVAKDALTATLGIQVNNFVGNTLAKHVLNVTGVRRSGLKVGTAVALPLIVSLVAKRYTALACAAGSAAIAIEASKLLNRKVYPSMGDLGNSLSTSDEVIPAGGVPAGPPAPRPFGYNSRLTYPPGTAASTQESRLGTYVRRLPPGMRGGGSTTLWADADQPGVYAAGSAGGVY